MRGMTLLELLAAITITAVAAGAAAAGAASLHRSALLESASARLASVLLDARLQAYQTQRTTSVSAAEGSTVIRAFDGATVADVALPASIRIAHATRGGIVRFYPSGLSDNASWILAATPRHAGAMRRVVVNQRSVIRRE